MNIVLGYVKHVLEDSMDKAVVIGLDQDKHHVGSQHHGRIHSPGVDWNPKDLGLHNVTEAEL